MRFKMPRTLRKDLFRLLLGDTLDADQVLLRRVRDGFDGVVAGVSKLVDVLRVYPCFLYDV